MSFKSNNGGWFTKALFKEFADKTALFTLKQEDQPGYPSLYKIYMESCLKDPSEYTFANTHLGGWAHWKAIRESSAIAPVYETWREELEVAFKAQALAKVFEIAEGNTKDVFAANKYILQEGWEKPAAKGRPSKEAIQKEAHNIAIAKDRVESDFDRLMVNS